MLGRSHRFLGITSTFGGVNVPSSRTQHGLTRVGLEPRPLDSESEALTTRPPRSPELEIFTSTVAVEDTVPMEASCGAVTPVVTATCVAMKTRSGVIGNNGTKYIYQYSSCRGYSANGS